MKRSEKIRIASGVIVIGLGYLGIRSWQRSKLFDEILLKIGPNAGGSTDEFDAYWRPSYAEGFTAPDGRAVLGIDDSAQLRYANSIYDAGGTFNDDEEAFYGTLRQIPDGVALSLTAGKFQRKYNQDLKEYIDYYLDAKTEQQKIVTILKQMPPYRIAAQN
jgi:hypothetical protein